MYIYIRFTNRFTQDNSNLHLQDCRVFVTMLICSPKRPNIDFYQFLKQFPMVILCPKSPLICLFLTLLLIRNLEVLKFCLTTTTRNPNISISEYAALLDYNIKSVVLHPLQTQVLITYH